MRIVDVCAFYSPQGGGVRTYVERKLAAARAGAEEVIIVAPGKKTGIARETAAGRIVTIESPAFPLDRRYRYFRDEAALHALLDQLDPDVVEASSPWSSASIVARWRGRAVRSLVMHADPLAAYAYRWFGGIASRDRIDRGFDLFWRHLRNLDRDFDMVISASDSLATRLTAGGLGKVLTIPMGVDPGLFSPGLRDETLRRSLLERCALGPDATLLLGLGRHAAEKRWPMVIEAITAVAARHAIGFVLLGDGRERAKVARAARDNPHVQLLAPIRDRQALAAIIASADALVHGCEAETFCIAAAEAKASGLPLIVPDEGGAADQFVRGTGELYAARSAPALADAIGRFVDTGAAPYLTAAASLAGQVPSMDDHMRWLFDTYRDALSRRQPVARAA